MQLCLLSTTTYLQPFVLFFFSLTVTAKYLPQQLPTDILHLFSSAVQSPWKIVRYYKHACIPTEKAYCDSNMKRERTLAYEILKNRENQLKK